MDLNTMWAIIVGLVVAGFTLSSVADSMNPKPPRNMNKFDAIDDELTRLHQQAEDSPSLRVAIYEQVNALNSALISEKEISK